MPSVQLTDKTLIARAPSDFRAFNNLGCSLTLKEGHHIFGASLPSLDFPAPGEAGGA